MGKRAEQTQEIRISDADGEPRGGCLKRAVIVLVIVIAIILIALPFGVNSPGGRDFITSHCEKKLGLELKLEKTRIGWPYVLVIEGFKTLDRASDGKPVLTVSEVRIGLTPSCRVSLTAVKPDLRLTHTGDNEWSPKAFRQLGDIPARNITHVSLATEGFRRRHNIYITEGDIHWLDEDGRQQAAVGGLSLDIRPARVPGHRMFHYGLKVYRLVEADGAESRDVSREWLASEKRRYIELSASGSESIVGREGFWNPAPEDLRDIPEPEEEPQS